MVYFSLCVATCLLLPLLAIMKFASSCKVHSFCFFIKCANIIMMFGSCSEVVGVAYG